MSIETVQSGIRQVMRLCYCNLWLDAISSETVSVEVFHWIYQQGDNYLEVVTSDKVKAKAYYRKLHLVVSAYNELLKFILMLDNHKENKYRALSATLKGDSFPWLQSIDIAS